MGIFDIDHKNKCPLCGKSMDFIYGDMVCSDCGYRSSYSDSSTTAQTTSSVTASQNTSTPSASTPPKQTTTPKITYTYTSSDTAKSSKKSTSKAPIVLIVAVFIFIFAGGVINFAISAVRNMVSVTDDFMTYTAEPVSPLDDINAFKVIPEVDEPISETYDADLSENSEGMIEVIQLIFEKDISKITAEELASITYLDFYYYNDYKVVGYERLADNNIVSGQVFPADVSFYDTDFSVFPNLNTLYMDYGAVGSLQGLDQLCVLGTDMTPSEITALMNPAQLTSLSLTDLFFAHNLSGIEEFVNLTSLTLEADYVDTIEPLSNLNKLKTLRIYDGYGINSFKALYELTQLEYLYLDCKKLRDIGFVSNMPALTSLTIWNSELKNIEALADCSNSLTLLDLSYNYELTNYDVVSQLTKLEALSLFVAYSFDYPVAIPQLGNMPNLTQLLLGNFDDFSELANAPGLEALTLYDTYAYDFSALASLHNLKSLELYDMSLEPAVFEPVMGLTNLEYISLDGSFIWGNVEGLLQLPNLREFYMADCTAGFDVENLTQNPALEVLDINNSELRALKDGKWDYNDDTNILPLSDYTESFALYPNLRELYIAGHEIENIDFVTALPYLEILDITDNYVKDLTALSTLNYFQFVMCYNNPIVDDGNLGNKIGFE